MVLVKRTHCAPAGKDSSNSVNTVSGSTPSTDTAVSVPLICAEPCGASRLKWVYIVSAWANFEDGRTSASSRLVWIFERPAAPEDGAGATSVVLPANVLAQVAPGGAVLSFDVRGGREQAWRVVDATRVLSITANLGDTKSLAVAAAYSEYDVNTKATLGEDNAVVTLSVQHGDPKELAIRWRYEDQPTRPAPAKIVDLACPALGGTLQLTYAANPTNLKDIEADKPS